MTWFHVLVEGSSDVPAVREVLERRFKLRENEHFQIHPHRGKGRIPDDVLSAPEGRRQGLLDLLPAKLRGWSWLDEGACVLVVIDADDEDCSALLGSLVELLGRLPKKPPRVLFRIAIEETESWFIADEEAVKAAYPRARTARLKRIAPDAIVGASEVLAEAIGARAGGITPFDKRAWAERIAPHLDLKNPKSPSLGKLISGIEREIKRQPQP